MTAEVPWLTIIGIGEDGVDGLSAAARATLEQARFITGAQRHLALLPPFKAERLPWPAPFETGVAALIARRGQPSVMLASGDPFWFGAGASIARHLTPGEWVVHPAPSTFSIAAARLGWPLQDTACHGLHAAPFSRLRPDMTPGGRAIILLRDGAAAADLARYLAGEGFGASTLRIMESLGGPQERIRETRADNYALADVAHPVAAAVTFAGGPALPRSSGRADDWFDHDGQITKRPVRALTLSALAPRAGETLWDIGAGSGSIAIEWLLSHASMQAVAFESDPVRAARARANAARLGVDRLTVREGRAPAILAGESRPDAVFIGGGLSEALLETIFALPGDGPTRLVANAVTLESETLLAQWHARRGGELLRIDIASAEPLGSRRGWRASYPIVQWSVAL